jgi:ferric-dicitrate binding protein FerR (iron transport regulator)
MERKKRKSASVSFRRIHIAVAAVAASVLLAVIITASYRMGRHSTQNIHSEVNIQTCKAVSGKTQIALPDGSSVWLNQGSELSYETSFLSDRKIQLTGEALFEVRSDAKLPFTVQADEVQVKVSGTRFNVQAYPARQDIRVALLEGKIAVSAGKEELAIVPGDIASFDRKTRQLSSIKDDVAFEAFWANNSCTFEAKPLGHICKYLERWYNIKIRLEPAIADTQVYTFSITDEPLEMILQIMSRINPVRYSFGEDRTVTISDVKPLKNKRL